MTGVSCYRNLNRKGVVWSVKSNRTGLVVDRNTYVMLRDVELKVSKAGRARVLREKRKNVHAYVKGTWVRGDFKQHVFDTRGCIDGWVRLKYNPYEGDTFVRQDTGEAVHLAKFVILDKDGAWALLTE